MNKTLSKFWIIYKVWWQNELEYRLANFTYIFNGLVGVLFMMVLWLATAKNSQGFPMSPTQVVTYFILSIPVGRLTQVWSWERMEEEIRSGGFSNFLLKPISYLFHDLAENLGRKTMRLSGLAPAFFLVYLFFRKDIQLPSAGPAWPLFLLAILFGFTLRFFYENFMGVTTFWLTSVHQVAALFSIISGIFSGSNIPLSAMPTVLLNVAKVLPFRFFVSFPLEIVLGQINSFQIAQGFLICLFWILLFSLLFKPFLAWGIKVYEAVGG